MCKCTSNMSKLRRTTIHFNNKFLKNLVAAKTPCLEVQRSRKHVTLFPYHLNNINNSIKALLNEEIAKYNNELEGILLGFQNIKLLRNLGTVNYDSCFIHIDIEADFYVFKPIVGKELLAVVNKKSKDHVGCLIHKTFNISVPKPEYIKNWSGDGIQLGEDVSVRILYTNFDGRLPYIRGEFVNNVSEDSGVSTSEETNPPNKKIVFDDNLDGLEELLMTSLSNSQKHKKGVLQETGIDSSIQLEQTTSKKHKNRKKNRERNCNKEHAFNEDSSQEEVVNTEDPIEKLTEEHTLTHTKLKKGKKHKRDKTADIEVDCEQLLLDGVFHQHEKKKAKKKKEKNVSIEIGTDCDGSQLSTGDVNLQEYYSSKSISNKIQNKSHKCDNSLVIESTYDWNELDSPIRKKRKKQVHIDDSELPKIKKYKES